MNSRARKMARIMAIQTQLHRLAEWDLMELNRRESDLQDRQQRLVEALNDRDSLAGLFAESTSRRLTAAGGALAVVAQDKTRQADHVLAAARRLKQASRMASDAAAAEDQFRDRRTLEDVVALAAAAPDDADKTLAD